MVNGIDAQSLLQLDFKIKNSLVMKDCLGNITIIFIQVEITQDSLLSSTDS